MATLKLLDLDPEWVFDFKASTGVHKRATDANSIVHYGDDELESSQPALTIANAQGILFLCPKCFVKNGGRVGTESVLCWFRDRSVPDNALPGPGRWLASGTSFADLTLSPSVNVDHEHWHGFIVNGEIR